MCARAALACMHPQFDDPGFQMNLMGKYYPLLLSEVISCLKHSGVNIKEAHVSSDGKGEICRFVCQFSKTHTSDDQQRQMLEELRESVQNLLGERDSQVAKPIRPSPRPNGRPRAALRAARGMSPVAPDETRARIGVVCRRAPAAPPPPAP